MSCVANPYYSGAGNETDYYDTPFYDSVTGEPCTYSLGGINGGTVYGGNTTTNTGGTNHVFDTVMNSILSGIALFKKAPYVPTSANPYNQPPPTIITNPIGSGGGGIGGGGNNANNSSITAGTLGKVEAWVKKNPGASAIIGLGIAAVFLGPALRPQGARR